MLCSDVFDEPQNGIMRSTMSGIADRPLVGLPRAHRPAGDQRQLLDAELLGHQAMLLGDVVLEGDLREARAVVRRGRVARRGRQSVAQHVGNDDEVFRRIERHPLTDQPLVVVVLAGIPGRIDDGVAFVAVERAEGLVGELGIAQRLPGAQSDVAQFEYVVIGHLAPPPRSPGDATGHGGRKAAGPSASAPGFQLGRLSCAEAADIVDQNRGYRFLYMGD